MQRFAELLSRLLFTPGRNAKLALLEGYFASTPDPDRGWALAALAGGIELPNATPSRIRGLVEERVDPVLFRLSYDYVGDLAETVALIWPEPPAQQPGPDPAAPRLGEVVDLLQATGRSALNPTLAGLFDALDASARLALIKLCTGGMRVG
ncbi:MAG: ATP-dependent DNA ligase, partial [Pseudomonadota bacterium]